MNSKPLYQCRRLLISLDRQHGRQLRALLTPDPFLKGSVIIFKRKCGKKACSCRKGQPHESLVISRWVSGKLKVAYARSEDRTWCLAYRDRYQKFRKDKKDLIHLQKQILKKLDYFVKLKTERYTPGLKKARG